MKKTPLLSDQDKVAELNVSLPIEKSTTELLQPKHQFFERKRERSVSFSESYGVHGQFSHKKPYNNGVEQNFEDGCRITKKF